VETGSLNVTGSCSATLGDWVSKGPAEPTPLLGLCMIVRNESDRIAAVLDTYAPIIDRWTILDTGSTDGTQDIVRATLADIPGLTGTLYEEPFVDFATSRNRALELHGTQTIFAIMPNGDYLSGVPQLRTFLESKRDDSATAYNVRIAPGHYYHPLVLRTGKGWHYVGRTHECLMGSGIGMSIPDVMLIRDRSKRTDTQWRERWLRDLQLLRQDVAEKPGDCRAYFYLGQTHDCLGHDEEALFYYQKRAAMPGYFDETFEAKLRIGKMHERRGRMDQAIAAWIDAYAFDARRAEPLSYIAEHYHRLDQHALAYLYASRAADIPKPATDLFLDEGVYNHRAAELAAIHGYYLSDVPSDVGRRYAEKAVKGAPHDERIRANHAFYARSAAEMFGATNQAIDFTAPAPYTPSTPSICKTSSGWKCIVRTVNYRIDSGRYIYPDGDPVIRTRNFMLALDDEFRTIGQIEINDCSERPFTDCNIKGYEDCRLFEHRGKLYASATVCDLSDGGRRDLVLCHLDDNATITRVVPLLGPWSREPQKNWMPMQDGDRVSYMAFVYSASPPSQIVTVNPDVGVNRPPQSFGHGRLRGGSQALPYGSGYVALVHDVAFPGGAGRMYLHRFVQMDPTGAVVAMTDPFYFERLGIEFCAGLARVPGEGRGNYEFAKFVASYSVADASARLAVFPISAVMDAMRTDFVI
jgi:tetratricopeptide (TPR) repeat protein